jgi:hypothetical protein
MTEHNLTEWEDRLVGQSWKVDTDEDERWLDLSLWFHFRLNSRVGPG